MFERQWYYAIGNQTHGPVAESELQRMLDTGALPRDTFVWAQHLPGWTPASQVEPFRQRAQSAPPVVQSAPPSPQPMQTIPSDVPQVRPWVRWLARSIDYTFFGLSFGFVCGVILGILSPGTLESIPDRVQELAFGIINSLVWVFVEAAFLSVWGTTPGKWLLKTSVRDAQGNRLTYSRALSRSFDVWLRGMGCAVPVIVMVTMIVGYYRLTRSGMTSWDRDGGFVVVHERIGPGRVLLIVLIYLAILAFLAVLTYPTVNPQPPSWEEPSRW